MVATPDTEMGEKACAYTIPEEGENLTLEAILRF